MVITTDETTRLAVTINAVDVFRLKFLDVTLMFRRPLLVGIAGVMLMAKMRYSVVVIVKNASALILFKCML